LCADYNNFVPKSSYSNVSNFIKGNVYVPGLTLQVVLLAERQGIALDTNSIIKSISPYIGDKDYYLLDVENRNEYVESSLRPKFNRAIDSLNLTEFYKGGVSLVLRKDWDKKDIHVCITNEISEDGLIFKRVSGKNGFIVNTDKVYIRDTHNIISLLMSPDIPKGCLSIGKIETGNIKFVQKVMSERREINEKIIFGTAYFDLSKIEKTSNIPNTLGFVVTGRLQELEIVVKDFGLIKLQ
jgi:hypothetical protein